MHAAVAAGVVGAAAVADAAQTGCVCAAVRGSEAWAATWGLRREGGIGPGRIGVSPGAMGGRRRGRGVGRLGMAV